MEYCTGNPRKIIQKGNKVTQNIFCGENLRNSGKGMPKHITSTQSLGESQMP